MDKVHVTFLPSGFTAEGVTGDTILDVALANGVALFHDCGGNCACTTCHVIVREGKENLSAMEEVEEDRISTADNRTSQSRLGCQALVWGAVVVEIPEDDLWG